MKNALYILLFFSSLLSAQNTSIVSAAENAHTSSGIINWVIGSTITGSSKTSKYNVSQSSPIEMYQVIYDKDAKLKIKCFPNPAKTHFFLELQTNTPQEYNWKLYSTTGKILTENKSNTDLIKININGLNAAVYYLSVLDKKGTIAATAKIIKL